MQRCMGCMAQLETGAAVCPHCGYMVGTAPREAYHLAPGTVLNDRYVTGRTLGYGGFGVTYIGWDMRLGRIVAVKEYLPSTFATRVPGNTLVTAYQGEATEQFGAGLVRFIEEAQLLAQFNGIPGIVDIYDTISANSTAYIIMEYLQGRDVKDVLASAGPMPYEQARDIILQVCDTLAPVHAKGIIHRDISPDNIYLTDGGEVKLLDFGASRYATSVNSKSLSVILKAGYAPEEQYRSKGNQGPWSDVYALAATFYKMLTGETPQDAMERAIKDELAEPSKLGAQLPKSAENAIMNALNVKQADRTQSAEAFKAALLEDGVKRVKGKTVKNDTGATPKWAKGVLGISVAALLVFGVLTLTGVVDFGQGNILRDTFGSAVPQGHINAPGIVNLPEEDAKAQVQGAGLDYMIVGTSYDDKIEKGRILSQEPQPGRVIKLGERVEVTVSGGSEAEMQQAAGDAATEGGAALPDLTYQDVQKVVPQLQNQWNTTLGQITYRYDDSVTEGLILEQADGENGTLDLVVSAGRQSEKLAAAESGTAMGTVVAPLLVARDGEAMLEFGLCMPQGDPEFEFAYLVAAPAGATFPGDFTVGGTDLSTGEFDSEQLEYYRVNHFNQLRFIGIPPGYTDAENGGQPRAYSFPVAELLGTVNYQLAGQQLDLGIALKNSQDTTAYKWVGQPFWFEYTLEDLHMNAMRYIEWEKIGNFIADGRIPEESNLGSRYQFVASQTDDLDILGFESGPNIFEYCVALDSIGFELGQNYKIRSSMDTNVYDYICPQEGTIAVVVYGGKTELWALRYESAAFDEKGMLCQVMDRPGSYTVELPTS